MVKSLGSNLGYFPFEVLLTFQIDTLLENQFKAVIADVLAVGQIEVFERFVFSYHPQALHVDLLAVGQMDGGQATASL